MTSAMRWPASNFSLVPMLPHLPSPLLLLSSFSRLPLDPSGSCIGKAAVPPRLSCNPTGLVLAPAMSTLTISLSHHTH